MGADWQQLANLGPKFTSGTPPQGDGVKEFQKMSMEFCSRLYRTTHDLATAMYQDPNPDLETVDNTLASTRIGHTSPGTKARAP